ncbi:hypothetical protein [Paenibacillus ehimensis]|uniref:hypothetical protein n=1 Tax=Paenibacillus ehimensis TaxID=79264 RepID=UPI00046F58AA|nr:hypothetical protein [Paenibacillus ehimensis]
MILYLTHNNNVNLLDFIEQEQELPVKKLIGKFSLLSFVIKDMRHFSHVRYVVIDRTAIIETDEEMLQALLSFQTMYQIRIIIIADGLPEGSPFLQQMVCANILNVVTAEAIDDLQREIRECFSEEGMQRFKPAANAIFLDESPKISSHEKEEYRFNCTNITIAIAGCDRRVGVTTTAINLVCWINAHGGTACYLEANTSNHLAYIIHMFQLEKIENAYVMEGIDFYLTKELHRDYNFIVVDCGVLRDQKLQEAFVNADVRVLCGSAMPYELPVFYKAIERCKELSVLPIGLFVPDDIKPILQKSVQTKILFAKNSHDLFDSYANKQLNKKLLMQYLLEYSPSN